MKIKLVSIPVPDQEIALKFYTEILGFVKKHDIPLNESHRWLTLVSPEEPGGPEILLEPSPVHFEPAKTYQKAVYDAGLPYTQFNVDNIVQEFERLSGKNVKFSVEPTDIGDAVIAVFDDTCGNHIQLVEVRQSL